LIPRVQRCYRYSGRKRLDDRKVLSGILFVLRTGIQWEYLPQEMGCGSGVAESAHGSGLGTKRWVVERTIAWLH
jgi:transposase